VAAAAGTKGAGDFQVQGTMFRHEVHVFLLMFSTDPCVATLLLLLLLVHADTSLVHLLAPTAGR
jgi:hypothetical protein